MVTKCVPDSRITYWTNTVDVPQDVNWDKIHNLNLKCTIDTRLRSFYFKIFHKAIALNEFLFRIKRKTSPNCSFCDKVPETMIHLVCNCENVSPIWQNRIDPIHLKHSPNFRLTRLHKVLWVITDKFLSYLFYV